MQLMIFKDLKDQIMCIEKSIVSKESHYISKVIRNISKVRKEIDNDILLKLVNHVYPDECEQKTCFTECLQDSMETDFVFTSFKNNNSITPEIEIYLSLLFLVHFMDTGKGQKAIQWSNVLIEKLNKLNQRSMDILSAKCYFYYSLSHEKYGQFDTIRSVLLARLRTCTLRKDTCGQATIINLLLRNYLAYNLYDQANKLVGKVSFPEEASNKDLSTYMYYLGRIKAIQLDYSDAHTHLISALRKAPQNGAIGFKQTVHKLNIVVELLLGELPDRAIFRDHSLKFCLAPYFQLTRAVHAGDLSQFNIILEKFENKFLSDKMYTLIVRMRHNVIKTGIKMIASSYSCISLDSIAKKLQLESCEDAEFIVAKAIKDGIINAKINHENGCITTKELHDVYSTKEPLSQFNERIRFCFDIRNQSAKAMSYPSKPHDKDLTKAVVKSEDSDMDMMDELDGDEFEDL